MLIDSIDNLLFRASGIGKILPNKKGEYGITQIKKIIDCYVDVAEGRREEFTNKYFKKGNVCESSSTELLSRHLKRVLIENKNPAIRLNNKYISGELDIFIGRNIEDADETLDTKTSWSRNTFLYNLFQDEEDYKWQGVGYMWLSNAKKHTVAYCLVNADAKTIIDEKAKARWKIDEIDYEYSQEYQRICKKIELNHIFDIQEFVENNPNFDFHNDIDLWLDKKDIYDIPREQRVLIKEYKRSEDDILIVKNAVIQARKLIKEYIVDFKYYEKRF